MTPTHELAAVREATARLLDHLAGLSDEDLRRPSLLPGWTRAHVVAHLAGNADSHVRMLEGCLAGEVRTQYAGGAEERASAIDALAADPAAARAAHAQACRRLEECWTAMGDEHWGRGCHWLDAPAPSPAWREPASRRREVEVHGVDLDSGFAWSPEFARELLGQLAARTDLPPLVLVSDEGAAYGGAGLEVRGTADALARWLSGRSRGAGLRTGGRPLPDLPAWR